MPKAMWGRAANRDEEGGRTAAVVVWHVSRIEGVEESGAYSIVGSSCEGRKEEEEGQHHETGKAEAEARERE